MDNHDFQLQVIESLSELKTETKNVVARLDKLNGSVARHEEAIGALKIQMASRDAERKALHPIVYAVLSFCITAISLLGLTHSDDFLSLIK